MPHRNSSEGPGVDSVCSTAAYVCVCVCVCVYERERERKRINRADTKQCIGSDTSCYLCPANRAELTTIAPDGQSKPARLTSADTEVFEGVRVRRGTVDGLHLRRAGRALQLVGVDGPVGVLQLHVGPNQRHLLLVAALLLLFHLHHHRRPLRADGRYVPVHGQDDKLEQHPQQTHEDLRVWDGKKTKKNR